VGAHSAGGVLLQGGRRRAVRPGAAVRASESLPDNRWDDRPGTVPAPLCLRATAEEATPQCRPLLLLLLLVLFGASCRLQPIHASVLGFIFHCTCSTAPAQRAVLSWS